MSEEAPKIIFSMNAVSKAHEKKPVLRDISLSFFYGAKIGVLGLNGSGKSTLLRIIAGTDKAFDGQLIMQPGYSVGLLEQEPKLDPQKTVRQCVEEGVADKIALLREYDELSEKMGDADLSDEDQQKLIDRQGDVQEQIDTQGLWDLDSQLDQAMDALRCPEPDTRVDIISGGEKRRVALCRLLLQAPDILLLDEPTNHLDAESVAWLERHLKQYPGTVIAVTHDRYFLDHVAGWILELDRGHGIPWKGNYSSWLDQKQKRLAVEEKQASARRKTLERELEWIGQSPKGRQAKSKARISAYEKLLAQDVREKDTQLEIYIPPGPRLGTLVLRAEKLSKAYGERVLLENVSFSLPPGGIVGVIGPNGAGKTTLFRMIAGEEKPDAGALELGETVKLAYVNQSRESLPDTHNVFEAVTDNQEFLQLGPQRVNGRVYVARFGFAGADQQKKVGLLSGGERNRVHLARLLRQGANVILLDEPTNDLDVNTIRALEEALENFAGCAVVVSHDRWFLDRVATHILAFEGDGTARFFEGNYSDYEQDRRKRLGQAADTPHRMKYRRLSR